MSRLRSVPEGGATAVVSLFRGVYPADRAAALAGVPRSTLYYWARHEVWTPTRRATRPKLWTYSDVVAARIIYWLRRDKPEIDSAHTSMPQVREALAAIRTHGKEIWDSDLRVLVDREGHVFFKADSEVRRARKPWTSVEPGALDVLGQFLWSENRIGPDLVEPRPHLRIIPGKLGGEPHVKATRIGTRAVAALLRDGLTADKVESLYPDLTQVDIEECRDLEAQLQANLVA